jgi:hypothetical protein
MSKKQGWQHGVLASMAGLALVLSWGCDRPAEPKASAVEKVDPARILRQMSDTLAHARQLAFKATRQLDAALVEGGVVAESAEIEVSISRPQMVRARMVSGAGVRRFYADGQRVSLLDEGMKLYATVSLAGTIDDMVNALDERYGFTPPLADFVVNDPYQKFSTQIQSSLYKGKEAVNGVECDHLTLTGEIADADVWISIADHLPRRFVATFKDREGSPKLKVDFSEWTLAAKLDESTFVFDPPTGAEKIVMAAIEDVKAFEVKDSKP